MRPAQGLGTGPGAAAKRAFRHRFCETAENRARDRIGFEVPFGMPLHAKHEGLIDPQLRTLSFWDGDRALAALHFYACHPMSYYGDGRVSADFCGLARQKRQDEDAGVFQVYLNGCGGNVTAGKYNDGARENRAVLRDRIHTAMTAAWRATTRTAVDGFEWRVEPVRLPPRREESFGEAASRAALADEKAPAAKRNNAAFQLAWLKRIATPIELGCLDFGGKVLSLHLPGEAFVETRSGWRRGRTGSRRSSSTSSRRGTRRARCTGGPRRAETFSRSVPFDPDWHRC